MQSLVSFRQAGRVAARATKKTSGTERLGGSGYRKFEGAAVWLPGTTRPAWLDGTLPGDRGFDPLGLSKPDDYVQIDVDENDINAPKNNKGSVEGFISPDRATVSENRLAPYAEVFGLQRFRENELIHGRWCMLACLGVLVAEATTGVSWVDAGKVELDGSSYAGLPLPFDLTQLIWIEVILVGGAEFYRNSELDTERRLYPGGPFDPLGLSSKSDEQTFRLREAEIKHGRLAMISFLGFSAQAFSTGEGALGSLAKFTNNL